MTKDVPMMKVWWLLSVVMVALVLEVLILAGAMPLALRAVSAVLVVLWMTALVYFIVGRW